MKFYFIICAITLIFSTIITYISTSTFIDDKKSYLYEFLYNSSNQSAKDIDRSLSDLIRQTSILSSNYLNNKSKFRKDIDSVSTLVKLSIKDTKRKNSEEVLIDKVGQVNFQRSPMIDLAGQDNDNYYFLLLSEKLDLVKFELIKNTTHFSFIYQTNIGNLFSDADEINRVILYNKEGHRGLSNPQLNFKVLQTLHTLSAKGLRKRDINGKPTYISCSPIVLNQLQYCLYTSESKITEVIHAMIFKIFLYFILGICIVCLVSYPILKKHTEPIENLTRDAIKISEGDFSIRNKTQSRDEVGKLSKTFNMMLEKIQAYIEELKDKVRMEQELKLANTVQNFFFPKEPNIKLGKLEISGFYKTASECGGDWWGYKEINDKCVIFLGDATGHGASAALITSAVCSASQMISQMLPKEDQVDPAEIMRYLNSVVYSLGQEVLMTFVVLVIDQKNNKLSIANASHHTPYLSNDKGERKVLKTVLGKRLGQDQDATYETAEFEFKKNDAVLVFTDGFTEAENSQGRQYGERSLLKSFMTHAKQQSSEIIESLCKDFYYFADESKIDDDLTIVCAKLG